MEVGKLPNELLAQLLEKVTPDPGGRVVVGPKVGEDAAVIEMGDRLLVAKSDPITFASDLIGWYAVHINANDVACMGARPAWFLATILLPSGASPALAGDIFEQIVQACRTLDVQLVGGHTEVTYRLERPLVVGAMLGEVERQGLVRGSGARPGAALILSKGIAIEGTAVLAREAAAALRSLGVGESTLEEARGYIFQPGISIVGEARAACRAARVQAMHDPTEGGLATALYELASASGVGIAVAAEAIEVLPATREVAEAAGLDPWGMLASGSLLIAVAAEEAGHVLSSLAAAGVAARRIGRIVNPEAGVIIEGHDKPRPVSRFARDEVARFLAQQGATANPDSDRGHL